LCADDGSLASFAQHEKTLLDNADFLYWVVQLTKLDEREECAKIAEIAEPYQAADLIRARGEA